jgi:hypothetical protein
MASGNEITKKIVEIYNINGTILRANCSKIYKRSIINENQLRYEESMSDGEDFLFTLNYLLHVNHIRAISYAGYNYITYQSSLTKTIYDIESYVNWKKYIITALINVDSKFGKNSSFLDPILTTKLHSIINGCYLRNSLPKEIRLKTLSTVISLLTPARQKYIKKRYFILKMYKILPVEVIDSVLSIYGFLFRAAYKKIKKLK